jgi:ABC-type cobalamin/Fe3+-siderophores transport system ATPase subunit
MSPLAPHSLQSSLAPLLRARGLTWYSLQSGLRPLRQADSPRRRLSARANSPAPPNARAVAFPIIERVTFDVRPGEFVAIVGRNGAGKSTLLDLIAGLRAPAAGEIMLDDRPLSEWPAAERARTVGHLPQLVPGDVPFTAEQLVLMGRYPYADRWSESPEDEARVVDAMTRCACLEFRHRRLSTLSGGERQRVLLAACLAQQPRLLLLDEPATYLDIDQQLHCFTLLREETSRGAACLAVTHDLNLALTFCTRLLILADRTIAHDIPVASALDRPEWLALFSPRLAVSRTASGDPWISFAR